jgi:hypothetical protein
LSIRLVINQKGNKTMKIEKTIQSKKARRSPEVSKTSLYKLAQALVDEAYRRGYKAGLKSPPSAALRSIAAYKAHSTRRKNAR